MFLLKRDIRQTTLALSLRPQLVVREAVESMDAEAVAKRHVGARAVELRTVETMDRRHVRIMVLYAVPGPEGAD